jgi:signal transduction histidine kinase
MRLADFIAQNPDPILAEWVDFAATCGPAGMSMDLAGLRDHALDMLNTIVLDLRTPQSAAEQSAKAKGHAPTLLHDSDTPAEVHGAGRAESGFSVGEMVSEYRALRASVIRLWTKANGTLTGADLDDLQRFNETIDQALSESTERYTQDVDRAKEMFIAILGHDLRTPLAAVIMGSQFMLDTGELGEPHLTLTTRIGRSARRMERMVADLLDFTRGRLGAGVPITRGDMDMMTVVRNAVEEIAIVEPQAVVQFTATGDMRGAWDAARISQVVANLLSNAVQHGAPRTLITVTAQGEAADVILRVHNYGPPIAPADLGVLFSPFKRFQSDVPRRADVTNLGLGLYIAERIIDSHDGTIDVRSSAEAGTLFTIRLPRSSPPQLVGTRRRTPVSVPVVGRA